MRVVVHHPARTEQDGTEVPESTSAFRLGRIEDLVNPMTGETTPKEEVATALLQQAQEEFPGQDVKIEYLHSQGDETSEWRDHPPEEPASPGEAHAQELTAEQSTEVQP